MAKGLIHTEITADGAIVGSAVPYTSGWLRSILVRCDSTATGYIYIYDNSAAASGTLLFDAGVPLSTGQPYTTMFNFPGAGVPFSIGMYGDISGGTTSVHVYWDQ